MTNPNTRACSAVLLARGLSLAPMAWATTAVTPEVMPIVIPIPKNTNGML